MNTDDLDAFLRNKHLSRAPEKKIISLNPVYSNDFTMIVMNVEHEGIGVEELGRFPIVELKSYGIDFTEHAKQMKRTFE